MRQSRPSRRGDRGDHYVARFAGEVFSHKGNPEDGPIARRLTSEIAWKQPPSASLRAEVST
jgi:hypothetical protein